MKIVLNHENHGKTLGNYVKLWENYGKVPGKSVGNQWKHGQGISWDENLENRSDFRS